MATWPTIIDDDGSGTIGTVLNHALFEQVKTYIDDVTVWIDVPHNPFNFGASGTTWTVTAPNQATFAYALVGSKTMLLQIYLTNTTLAANWPGSLDIILPSSMHARYQGGTFAFKNQGVAGIGTVFTAAGNVLKLYRDLNSTAWTAGSVDILFTGLVSLA